MPNSPLVSIIIPTYNNAPVVCEAIDCSLHQTYGNVEVIVIDDGSDDGTERLVKNTYKDRIILVRQENKGPGSARNTGIRHASGKYIQFLDADDLLDPDKIRIQVGMLQDSRGMALSYCDYVCCDMDDISIIYKVRHLSPVLQKENPFDDILMKWETDLSIPMHCFLFDRAIFSEFGIRFDENLPANEDWDCWMDVFGLAPTVVFVDRVLAYYRIRKDSRCSDRLKMRKSHIEAINRQILKNRSNREVVKKLIIRKNKIKNHYRDTFALLRMADTCGQVIRKIYHQTVPWRIQRFFAKECMKKLLVE